MTLCESAGCRRDREDKSRTDPRPAADGLRVCWVCRDRLGEYLASLPGLAADCEQAMIRATGLHDKVSGTSEPGLPLNLAAGDARAQLLAVLAEWAGMVADERGIRPPGAWGLCEMPHGFIGPANRVYRYRSDAVATAGYLRRHLDWLCAHPAAGDLCAEVGDLVHIADKAAYPDPPRRRLLGPCVVVGCGGLITANVYLDRPERSAVVCDVEPEAHRWGRDRWHELKPARTAVAA